MAHYTEIQVPANKSGDFHCTAPGQSRTVYRNITPNTLIYVDSRDLQVFLMNGYISAVGSTPLTDSQVTGTGPFFPAI
jgi:hypothetical protein